MSSFTSSRLPDLISCSTGTTSKNLSCKRKGSSPVYLDCDDQQGCNKNARRIHSQIEKRRRDKMNSFIDELASLVPLCNTTSRKLDKLSVLRMAVQHMKTLRGSAGSRCSEVNHRPAFLSDEELKHLIQRAQECTEEEGEVAKEKFLNYSAQPATTVILISIRGQKINGTRAADGFLFVVDCNGGKILFVSESICKILNYSQNDLKGQSLFDYVHPKDVAKVKEQLSSVVTAPQEKTTDAKSGRQVKTDINPRSLRLCSGLRRSFFCRMRCKRNIADEDFSSSCLKKNDRKGFCTIHSTGYIKSWPPTEADVDVDVNNEPDNDGCSFSCLVAIGRLPPHTVSRPALTHVKVKPMEFVSRHAVDGKFVFVDQRATAILAYLPQELLGTSFYEYFHEDNIAHLAECHRQVLQMREKINTSCYKLKIKDGSFITLRSCWFTFMNPWTKEVECIVSTNTVVGPSGDRPVSSNHQPAASPHVKATTPISGEGKPGVQTVPGVPGGTRAAAGKIGRMIAEQLLEIKRMDTETAREKEKGNQAQDCPAAQQVTTSGQVEGDVL